MLQIHPNKRTKNILRKKNTIGLLFGTFNPIHIGHLMVAKELLTSSICQEIEIVLTSISPYKQNLQNQIAPYEDREKMCAVAIEGLQKQGLKISINSIEKTLPTPNYTHYTLRKILSDNPHNTPIKNLGQTNKNQVLTNKKANLNQEQNNPHPYVLIVGSDVATEITNWVEGKWIKDNFPIYVYPRIEKQNKKKNPTLASQSSELQQTKKTSLTLPANHTIHLSKPDSHHPNTIENVPQILVSSSIIRKRIENCFLGQCALKKSNRLEARLRQSLSLLTPMSVIDYILKEQPFPFIHQSGKERHKQKTSKK